MIFDYFIWNVNPDIFDIGSFTLKWNALLLITGFLLCTHIFSLMFKKEGYNDTAVSRLPAYLAVIAIVGGRLGYELIFDGQGILGRGISSLLPFRFEPQFHLVRPEAYSIHGATLAMLIFLWVYNRKAKLHSEYRRMLDKTSILTLLAAIFVFLASFFNSDPVGRETATSTGTVFIYPVADGLMEVECCIMSSPGGRNPLQRVAVSKDQNAPEKRSSNRPVILELFFKDGVSEQLVKEFLVGDVKKYLYRMSGLVHEPGTVPLRFQYSVQATGAYRASVNTLGISRYPVQVFEALGCLILFILLYRYWFKSINAFSPGKIFGLAVTGFWSLHLALGFIKANYHAMMTALDLLFLFAGLLFLVYTGLKSSKVIVKNNP